MNPQANRSLEGQGRTTNPLASLRAYGQAVWLDFLARDFIAEGGLKNAEGVPRASISLYTLPPV
jgi:hypothetical protein